MNKKNSQKKEIEKLLKHQTRIIEELFDREDLEINSEVDLIVDLIYEAQRLTVHND